MAFSLLMKQVNLKERKNKAYQINKWFYVIEINLATYWQKYILYFFLSLKNKLSHLNKKVFENIIKETAINLNK